MTNNSKKDFENKVVVITGATGGLGRVVARQFLEQEAKIVLVGTNLERLNSLGNDLGGAADQWLAVEANLDNKDASQKVLEASIAKFGHVDILLHLIGGWIGGKSLSQVTPADVDRMLKQHVWSTFYISQAFIPKLVENKWGRFIIVSSPSASTPPAGGLPYSLAKSGQEAIILTLAEELKGSSVTANIIRVRTIDADHLNERNPSVKTSNWTTPEKIATAMKYLCSDDASTINGARIPLYGNP